jgi:hypothetical protein
MVSIDAAVVEVGRAALTAYLQKESTANRK